jgi:transposase
MSKRKRYTEEFKKDAVRMMLARGTATVASVAKKVGISQSQLHRWHERYAAEVSGVPALSQQEREELEKMRRRLRELEQENALLKKAAALFAKDVK